MLNRDDPFADPSWATGSHARWTDFRGSGHLIDPLFGGRPTARGLTGAGRPLGGIPAGGCRSGRTRFGHRTIASDAEADALGLTPVPAGNR